MVIHKLKMGIKQIMKNYSKIIIVLLLSNLFFLGCTKKDEEIVTKETITNVTVNQNGATCCYINGTTLTASTLQNLCAPNAQAKINISQPSSFQYVNSTGNANSFVWSLTSNPVGSASIAQNGSNVTVSYLTNFIDGTLSIEASGGTAQTCNTNIYISK